MKFFGYFVAALVVILLIARFKPRTPAEPIIPTQLKEAQGQHGADEHAPPARTEAQGERQAEQGEGGTTAAPVPARPGQTYGAPVSAAGARPAAQLLGVLGRRDSAQVKLVGRVAEVCQQKGCWLTMPVAAGEAPMRVHFRDYSFLVPKDLGGRTVVVEGWAHRQLIPVEYLRHYAQDAGKSKAEVAAITRPEVQLTFQADGVLVQ